MNPEFSLNIKDTSFITIGRSRNMLENLLPKDCRIVVISDVNIDRLYGSLVSDYEHILIGVGESVKTLNTISSICHQLVEMKADRDIFLLGIGGGIVTDITGFVAAIYKRGVRFGFVSTTLLSQVDAGVGGKNGVNLDGYKNMIGTFLQPEFVICDVDMLVSLPLREFRAGLAEIIKSAILANGELFDMLESYDLETLRAGGVPLSKVIFESIKIKAHVVDMDEREAGERRKLNLGHTFAHAIEKSSSVMNHGEAVGVGLSIVTEMAVAMDVLSRCEAERVKNLLLKYGFELNPPVDISTLLKAIVHDKKAVEGGINMVLPTSIGSCKVQKMSIAEITNVVNK